jgi:hypothetical protein
MLAAVRLWQHDGDAMGERMGFKASYSTPMLHVMEIERSLDFYELLGL